MITGASGYLGSYLLAHPQQDWRIIPVYHQHKERLPKDFQKHAICATDDLHNIISNCQPDAILHTAAISKIDQCQSNPTHSKKINVDLTQSLTNIATNLNIPLLFTSTEQVFDGANAPYREIDVPLPKTIYGQHKLIAEGIVANYEKGIVARLPVMFGKSKNGCPNFFEEWLIKWQNGETVTVFYDEIRSFLSVRKAAESLFLLLNKEAEGLFHIGSHKGYSRKTLADLMLQFVKPQPNLSLIEVISQNDIDLNIFRPKDLTLEIEKIKQLGFNIGELKEMIAIEMR